MAKANPGIDTVELDVSDAARIRTAARHPIEKYPDLNLVINNAGIMPFDDVTGAFDGLQAVHLIKTIFWKLRPQRWLSKQPGSCAKLWCRTSMALLTT